MEGDSFRFGSLAFAVEPLTGEAVEGLGVAEEEVAPGYEAIE